MIAFGTYEAPIAVINNPSKFMSLLTSKLGTTVSTTELSDILFQLQHTEAANEDEVAAITLALIAARKGETIYFVTN